MTSRLLLTSFAVLLAVLIAPAAAPAAPSCDSPNSVAGSANRRGEIQTLVISCNGEVTSLELNGQPANGTADDPEDLQPEEGAAYGMHYTPNPSFEGIDSIPLKMNGSVAISLPVNIGLPTGCDFQSGELGATNRPNRSGTIRLACQDPDPGDILSATVTTPPTDGTLGTFALESTEAFPDGCSIDEEACLLTATYQAPSGPTGYRQFTITLSDDHGGSISYVVLHGINVGNAPPTCTAPTVTVPTGGTVSVPFSCSDPDSGPVLTTFDIFSPADEDENADLLGSIGPHSVTVPSGNPISTSVTYTAGGEPGTDTWKYTAKDEWGDGDKAAITVHVTPSSGGGGGGGGGGGTGGAGGGGAGGGGGTGTGGGSSSQPAGSNASVKSKQKGSSGAVTGSFTNAYAGASADLTVTANSGKGGTLAKVISLGKLKRTKLPKGKVIFKVKLSAKGKAALKKTLKKRKTVKVKVKIVVTPPVGSGGKRATFTRTVTLTR
jgi:hypothetical protein